MDNVDMLRTQHTRENALKKKENVINMEHEITIVTNTIKTYKNILSW